ncbi:hypothetical protein TYRP_012698 [Tyrophagus putrescentiae]|nr:hypothetical protein TYRP_012698 [Tyrophagus putrescentiae]
MQRPSDWFEGVACVDEDDSGGGGGGGGGGRRRWLGSTLLALSHSFRSGRLFGSSHPDHKS